MDPKTAFHITAEVKSLDISTLLDLAGQLMDVNESLGEGLDELRMTWNTATSSPTRLGDGDVEREAAADRAYVTARNKLSGDIPALAGLVTTLLFQNDLPIELLPGLMRTIYFFACTCVMQEMPDWEKTQRDTSKMLLDMMDVLQGTDVECPISPEQWFALRWCKSSKRTF